MAYIAPIGRVPPSIGGVVYQPVWNILLTIVTCGLWALYWVYRTHDGLKCYKGDGLGGVIGLLLAIFANPVVWFTIPYEIDEMYSREGRPSPVSVWWGLWFLVPILGNFVWYLRMQDALNDFWLSKGSSPT